MRVIRGPLTIVEVSLNSEGIGFTMTTPPPISLEEIERRFGYHRPVTDGTAENTAPTHAELRRRFMRIAETLNDMLPEGRAKSVAFTKLEETAMWCHKAIAMQDPVAYDTDPDPNV